MLPTIFTLKGVKLTANGVTTGIIFALVVGLPIFAYGNIYGIATYKTAGSLLTVLSAGIIAIIVSHIQKQEVRYKMGNEALGRKQRISNDAWIEAMTNIEKSVPKRFWIQK